MVVGAALTFISVVLLVVVKFRRSRSSGEQDGRQSHSEKHSGPNSTSLLHSTPSGKDLGPSGVRDGPVDEKDPDIIPAKFGEFAFTAENVSVSMWDTVKICVFSTASVPAVASYPISTAGSSLGYRGRGVGLTNQRSRKHGSVSSLPNTPSWCGAYLVQHINN
jgi:hypothetical protein